LDPFRLCLALGPVAVYAILLGTVNLSRRPFLAGGARDAAALGLALAGLVMIGPLELFFPDAATTSVAAAIAKLGIPPVRAVVWLLLGFCYAMGLLLILSLLKPRLVLYNVTSDQLRPILAELLPRLDPETRWAGDSVALPTLGVQFHIDNAATMRNISLAAVGGAQSSGGWRLLESRLAEALSLFEVGRNPRGLSLISAGLAILLFLAIVIVRHPDATAHGLFDLLL
jgi:uncharacterized membrane protein